MREGLGEKKEGEEPALPVKKMVLFDFDFWHYNITRFGFRLNASIVFGKAMS